MISEAVAKRRFFAAMLHIVRGDSLLTTLLDEGTARDSESAVKIRIVNR